MEKPRKTLQEHFVVIQNLMFIGLGFMVFCAVIDTGIWTWILMTLGLLIAVAGCIYYYKFFRCPHCGQLLNGRGGLPKFCPECGNPIQ